MLRASGRPGAIIYISIINVGSGGADRTGYRLQQD